MPDDPLRTLLAVQSGVVSRAQLLEHVAEHDLRRRLRRRELVVVHPGVYVDHTGEPTWLQQAWAAVLALWPAALCHESALRADDGPGRSAAGRVLHVAVARDRSPAPPPGVRLHRLAKLEDEAQWNLSPPRVRVEHAVVDVAAGAADELTAIAAVADAVQSRRTTARRLAEVLEGRQRIARRAFLAQLLADVDAGTCSALEHGYLDRVERAHGLPTAHRQRRESSRGPVYRDVAYVEQGVLVELDGRLFHDTATARDRDLERDLDVVLDGRITARLGWGQVFDRGCDTALKIGRLLQRRGWDGAPVRCAACGPGVERYLAATG